MPTELLGELGYRVRRAWVNTPARLVVLVAVPVVGVAALVWSKRKGRSDGEVTL